MKTFTLVYDIEAPLESVWNALTKPEIIEQWGAGPDVEMSDVSGDTFSLWGGDIYGTNKEVIKYQKIVQEWWGSDDWDEASIVTFTVSEQDGITTVQILHENIPDDSSESFEEGWTDFYMIPLKELVELQSD
jgi:uncharacterized protein YndB with AHSA1/START domain